MPKKQNRLMIFKFLIVMKKCHKEEQWPNYSVTRTVALSFSPNITNNYLESWSEVKLVGRQFTYAIQTIHFLMRFEWHFRFWMVFWFRWIFGVSKYGVMGHCVHWDRNFCQLYNLGCLADTLTSLFANFTFTFEFIWRIMYLILSGSRREFQVGYG